MIGRSEIQTMQASVVRRRTDRRHTRRATASAIAETGVTGPGGSTDAVAVGEPRSAKRPPSARVDGPVSVVASTYCFSPYGGAYGVDEE
jgi:hypothetical protein